MRRGRERRLPLRAGAGGLAEVHSRGASQADTLEAFCGTSDFLLQIRLACSLPWWSLTPALVGTILFVAATSKSPAAPLAFVLPIAVFVLGVVF